MDQASSSKVTVEYFDPYNVFQLLSPGLLPRLPLRNLHWESHAGPLRSIQTLHVDLVPAQNTRPPLVSKGSEATKARGNDATITESAQGQSRASALNNALDKQKTRRHQIPGLHQTPYLKIFFLRCDDNETYKASARKEVREWLKEHVPSADSTAKEGHDAFEWLIVHIVVPNTAASTQPKVASKGSTPLLEKLKNDFNNVSKHSIDRIAQIRIGINDVPYDLLPRVVPAIPGSYNETVKEHQETWIDLISKLKALILAAFDMRVSQYEENIREKDAQRSLPGWNFCTFFILKESLARGFESVGLVEDALVGYDELALMLESFCREQAATGAGLTFLSHTPDLRLLLEDTTASMLKVSSTNDSNETNVNVDEEGTNVEPLEDIPISAYKKNYRELVLANDISIFDFRCYMFARQLALLLRLANATISKDQLLAKLKEQQDSMITGVAPRTDSSSAAINDSENLVLLDQVCLRTLEFMAAISQIMRQDLVTIFSGNDEYDVRTTSVTHRAIENIVASFTFSVAQQILAQTFTRSLPIADSTMLSQHNGQGDIAADARPVPHPVRSTSLMSEPVVPKILPSFGTPSGATGYRSASVHGTQTSRRDLHSSQSGIEDLARHRAELYLLARNLLQNLGVNYEWNVGWNLFEQESTAHMTEISLSDSPIQHENAHPTVKSRAGISNITLNMALSTDTAFYRLYERLTDVALRHFSLAGHRQSMQSTLTDLAILKYHLKDYAAAASYFYRVTPFYADQGWQHIEMNMLGMYCESLKQLERWDDYTKVVMKLLMTASTREKERRDLRSQLGTSKDGISKHDHLDLASGYLADLLATLERSQQAMSIALDGLFNSVEVGSSIICYEGSDSFGLTLKLSFLLQDPLPVDSIKVRLIAVNDNQAKDIWLEQSKSFDIVSGTNDVTVISHTAYLGLYVVKEIVLKSGSLTLTHIEDGTAMTPETAERRFLAASQLQIFQQPGSIDIQLSSSRILHVQQPQALEISIRSGWNDILSGEIQMRVATAGMRLKTREFSVVSGTSSSPSCPESGLIRFVRISPKGTLCLRMPFNIETDVSEISIKCDISYNTPDGTFAFGTQLHVSCKLPLGVSVIDIFKKNTLFSKFSITTDNTTPLLILGSKLEGSGTLDVISGGDFGRALPVTLHQTATILYKVNKKSIDENPVSPQGGLTKTPLSLSVFYTPLTDQIEEAISSQISSRLGTTDLARYTRFVIKIVVHELLFRSSISDYERMLIRGEIPMNLIKDVKWVTYLKGLGKASRTDRDPADLIEAWLKDWIISTPQVSLEPITINQKSMDEARQIHIPVTIPSVTAVHTADLIFDDAKNFQHIVSSPVAAKNQAVSAILRINTSRAWDTTPQLEDNMSESEPLQFFYELTAPSEHYLLGGKRKGHFFIPFSRAVPAPIHEFPVLLVPIKEGFLPFPQLEISAVQPLTRPKSKESSSSGKQGIGDELVTCELDYLAAGDMIRVINGSSKSTFSLDASGPQGGAWLVGSESA